MGVNWTSRRIGGLLLVGWDWVCGRLRVGGGGSWGRRGGCRPCPRRPPCPKCPAWRSGLRGELGFPVDRLQARVLETEGKRGDCELHEAVGEIHGDGGEGDPPGAAQEAGSLTLVVSPSARQSGEFVRKAGAFAGKLGIRTKGDGDNQISLAFPNGSRIVGLPGTEATIRGFSAVALLLVDEAARVSDDLYTAIRPMLAVSGGFSTVSSAIGKHGQPDCSRGPARARQGRQDGQPDDGRFAPVDYR